MGAETTYFVEVETLRKEWRESYGVTDEDALANIRLSYNERATGTVVTPDQLKGEAE